MACEWHRVLSPVHTVCERTGRLKLPIEWSAETIQLSGSGVTTDSGGSSGGGAGLSFDAATHVPSLIYPSCFSDYDVRNPRAPRLGF